MVLEIFENRKLKKVWIGGQSEGNPGKHHLDGRVTLRGKDREEGQRDSVWTM